MLFRSYTGRKHSHYPFRYSTGQESRDTTSPLDPSRLFVSLILKDFRIEPSNRHWPRGVWPSVPVFAKAPRSDRRSCKHLTLIRLSRCFQQVISTEEYLPEGVIAVYWLFYSRTNQLAFSMIKDNGELEISLAPRFFARGLVWNGVAFSFTRRRVGFLWGFPRARRVCPSVPPSQYHSSLRVQIASIEV